MKMRRYSFAAAGIAALISGAVPNPACASDTAMQNPLRIERSAGAILLAENQTKLKKVRLNNVILKGYDPVAYFNQGKAVMGHPRWVVLSSKSSPYLPAARSGGRPRLTCAPFLTRSFTCSGCQWRLLPQ